MGTLRSRQAVALLGVMTSSKRAFAGKSSRSTSATYRSGLEEVNAKRLRDLGIDGKFEDPNDIIHYTSPATPHRYTRDFRLPNGIIIETKGIFDSADREKHLLIKAQHPHLDIRFVFTRAKARLSKSKLLSPAKFKAWLIENFKKTEGFGREERKALKNTFEAQSGARGDTYASWCDKHGFKWAETLIPLAWVREQQLPHERKPA